MINRIYLLEVEFTILLQNSQCQPSILCNFVS